MTRLDDQLAWLDGPAREGPSRPDTVLQACRAWRWARAGRWTSGEKAARWAIGRMSDPSVVEAALEARARGHQLDPEAVAGFLDAVRAAVAATRRRG